MVSGTKEALVAHNKQLIRQVTAQQKKIASLTAEVDRLKNRLDECRRKPNATTYNTTNNVAMVNFGEEPEVHRDLVRPLLTNLPPMDSVPRYVQLKHFTKPETSNVRIRNKKHRICQIVEADANNQQRWVDRDRTRIVSQITEKSLDELIEDHNATSSRAWRAWYEGAGLGLDGYDKTPTFQQLVRDVDNVITSQNNPILL